MFGIIYLVVLAISYIASYVTLKDKTLKEVFLKFNYYKWLLSASLLHILLACAGVYSSFNIFATMFLLGLTINVIFLVLIGLFSILSNYILEYDLASIDTSTEKGAKFYEIISTLNEELSKHMKTKFNMSSSLSTSVFIYTLNVLLIIGFYMNVKGGH